MSKSNVCIFSHKEWIVREWLLGKASFLSTFAQCVDNYVLPNSTTGGKRCINKSSDFEMVVCHCPYHTAESATQHHLGLSVYEVWHIFSTLRDPITWGWTTCPWSTVPERPRLLLFNFGWTVWWVQIFSPEAACVLTPVQLFKISELITCIVGKSVTFSSWRPGGITEVEKGGVEQTETQIKYRHAHIRRNERSDVLGQVPAFNTNRKQHSKSSHSNGISFSRLCFTAK